MACKIMARQFGVMLSQLHEISWSDLPYCFSERGGAFVSWCYTGTFYQFELKTWNRSEGLEHNHNVNSPELKVWRLMK